MSDVIIVLKFQLFTVKNAALVSAPLERAQDL